MNFNFGEVLTRAWQITWKHKVLWIFGILVGCTNGGGGGGGGGNSNVSNATTNIGNVPPELQTFVTRMEEFAQWTEDNWWIFVVLGLILILFVIVAIFVGTIGRIGLIKGSYAAEQGAEALVFGELFSISVPYFWRVFGLSFLIGLAFFILLIPFIVIGVLTAGVALLCLIPLICILIPVGIAVGIIIEQANRAIVIDDLSIMEGLKRGWEITKTNVGPLILMALILFGISLVIGIVIVLPILIVVFPTVFAFLLSEAQSFTPLYIAAACLCLYAPVSWVLNGILSTFTHTAWTLTYMRLTQKPERSETPIIANPDA